MGFWLSESAAAPPAVERLRAHEAVVRRALRSATPLPVRFGAAVFPDEAAAREALRESAEAFTATLERVAGRVEMGVRVSWRTAPAAPAAEGTGRPPVRSGREYLEARRDALAAEAERRRLADAALERVAVAFGEVEMETVREPAPEGELAGRLAQLVHLRDLGRYRKVAARARESLPELELDLTGPWAPYSFV